MQSNSTESDAASFLKLNFLYNILNNMQLAHMLQEILIFVYGVYAYLSPIALIWEPLFWMIIESY